MNCRGFLLFELITTIAIFAFSITGIFLAYGFIQDTLTSIKMKSEAVRLAKSDLNRAYALLSKDFYIKEIKSQYTDTYQGDIKIGFEDDVSRMIKSTISYKIKGIVHHVTFQRRITDITQARGKSTCASSFEVEDIDYLSSREIRNIEFGPTNIPTDIDAVGDYLFISTNSSKATDADLFIVDVLDKYNPILVSQINTGPGLSAIHVVGDYVLAANESINGQLQIIDVNDIYYPILTKTIKIPGIYSDNTTIGKKIFYDNNKIYLATAKSSIEELHIFDASNISDPIWRSSYEVGAGPNFLTTKHDKDKDLLYVASPTDPEIIILDVSDSSHPFLFDSFDISSGLANGKSLDRFDNYLAFGTTVSNNELYILDASQIPIRPLSMRTLGTSVIDLVYRSEYVFALTSSTTNPFQIFSREDSGIKPISDKIFPLEAKAISMDCDKKSFFILTTDPQHPLMIISK